MRLNVPSNIVDEQWKFGGIVVKKYVWKLVDSNVPKIIFFAIKYHSETRISKDVFTNTALEASLIEILFVERIMPNVRRNYCR